MKNFLKKNPHAWWTLYLFVYLLTFFLAEKLGPTEGYAVMYHPLDDVIPFCEYFIVFYVFWYVFMLGTGVYLLMKDGAAFRHYVWFLILGFTFSIVFGLIYPNGQDLRPALDALGRENIFTKIIGMIYAMDTNTLVCPSMHVIGSLGAVFATFDCKAWRHPIATRIGSAVLGALICASTLLVKQHSIVDMFWGVVVSAVLYVVVFVFMKKKVTYFVKKQG